MNRDEASPETERRAKPGRLIRYRVGLGVATSLVVAAAVTAVAWTDYLNTRAAMVSVTDERMDALLRDLGERVENHMMQASRAVELSRMLVRDSLAPGDRDGMARQFTLMLRASPSFSWVTYNDEHGNFTGAYRDANGALYVSESTLEHGGELREYAVGPGGEWTLSAHQTNYGYDPRRDPFYEDARKAGHRVWTGPYAFFDEGVRGVSCATPYLARDGHLLGVFTVDFNPNTLSNFVADLSFGKHGKAFILTPAGEVVAHPALHLAQITGQKSSAKVVAIADIADPLLRAFDDARKSATRMSGKAATDRFVIRSGGQEFFAGYRTVQIDQADGGMKWIVGAYAPESDFMEVLARNRRVAFVIAVVALGFGVLIALLLARRIAAPLGQLASEMEEIGNFQFSERPTMPTLFREIAMMDQSLLRMKGGLRSFSHYVPTDLVRAVLASGQDARLGGHSRQVSVYFCDIAGFTSSAETMTPAELVDHLGEYLNEMTQIVTACGGTIDKFIGDAVMAFWGAPVETEDHGAQACVAAIRSQRRLTELRATAANPWLRKLHARIGVATGEVLVGNIGTPERFNYTVMGDTVNLASRLEGLGKLYGTSILVSESAYEAARGQIVARPVDIVQVKGKRKSVRVYEPLCLASDDDETARRLAATFEEGLAAYVGRNFRGAIDCFERALLLRPQDEPASLLIERCRCFLTAPPPADWDGAYVATEK